MKESSKKREEVFPTITVFTLCPSVSLRPRGARRKKSKERREGGLCVVAVAAAAAAAGAVNLRCVGIL